MTRTCEVYTVYSHVLEEQVQCGEPAVGTLRVVNPHTREEKNRAICAEHNEARKSLVIVR